MQPKIRYGKVISPAKFGTNDHLVTSAITVNSDTRTTSQSAVASPEVKQHLKEFVSRRKKEEAASVASTGNLKAASAGPASGQPTPQPILRKTASESNLLKVGGIRTCILYFRL